MAPEAPDPQSLKSWHDAFQYPIPTVRRVEQELRRDIASNKEKLRALVGYVVNVGVVVHLLTMTVFVQNTLSRTCWNRGDHCGHEQGNQRGRIDHSRCWTPMQSPTGGEEVSTRPADEKRRCRPGYASQEIEKICKVLISVADVDKHTVGAQLALLHRCTSSIARLLRKRASLLLVAKILVVSRLLHKTLSQHESTPPFLDDLRNQLASLRRTLLKRIDKRLASNIVTEDSIVESLAAYCLATSSSSDDAIHHFHQVRLDVIVSQVDLSRDHIPKALHLFIRTLQSSKVLRSRQFSDVLTKLKARPVLSDPDIRNLDGLDIEILGRWTAPDVNNFTPWIKLSELSRTEGVEFIKEWSQPAFEKFAESFQQSLADSNDFSELLSLRADTLELWLSSWGSTITHDSAAVLQRLRNIFNDHLKRVLTAQVHSIQDVASHVVLIISNWEHANHSDIGSLWNSDLTATDFSNGAGAFKQAVLDRLLGRDDDVSTVLQRYQSWLASVQEVAESIDSLRRLKWTDILVGGEVEDEDIDIAPQLNEEDPALLSDALHSAVRQAFATLEKSFSDASKRFGTTHQSVQATFLLRFIRFVRRDIPSEFQAPNFTFSSEVVPELQKLLASEVIEGIEVLSLVPASDSRSQAGKLKVVPGRSLWEGDPAIPVQPSPATFKFLRRLTATMDRTGPDLWDPSMVRALKTILKQNLEAEFASTLKELEIWGDANNNVTAPETKDNEPAVNGKEDDRDASMTQKETMQSESHEGPSHAEVLHDWKIQVLFDIVYLATMLGDPAQLANVIEQVQEAAGPSTEVAKGVRKSAQEYWKRTELLFGLLAER